MEKLSQKQIKEKVNKVYKRDKEIALILENIQYARNVASMFRTADAGGVRKIYLTGISKTPPFGKELRQVSRGKENSVEFSYIKTSLDAIKKLKNEGYLIVAVELTDNAVTIDQLKKTLRKTKKVCFLFGSEVYGVNKQSIKECDISVLIPMFGKGSSLNVSVSLGVVL